MIVARGSELGFRQFPGRMTADPLRALADTGASVEGVSSRVVWVDSATTRNAHRHPHSPEVVYVAQGSGIAWQDGEHRVIGPGDVVFVPTGVPHATLPAAGGRLLLVCFFPHPNLGDNIEELERLVTMPGA